MGRDPKRGVILPTTQKSCPHLFSPLRFPGSGSEDGLAKRTTAHLLRLPKYCIYAPEHALPVSLRDADFFQSGHVHPLERVPPAAPPDADTGRGPRGDSRRQLLDHVGICGAPPAPLAAAISAAAISAAAAAFTPPCRVGWLGTAASPTACFLFGLVVGGGVGGWGKRRWGGIGWVKDDTSGEHGILFLNQLKSRNPKRPTRYYSEIQ